MSNRRKLKPPRITRVHENTNVDWGVYVFRCKSNGRIFRDEDNNVLNIPSRRFDMEKMKIIMDAAAHYGEPEGEAVFIPGAQRATDSEYTNQIERMKSGELPTMNDFNAVRDAKIAGRERGEKVGE